MKHLGVEPEIVPTLFQGFHTAPSIFGDSTLVGVESGTASAQAHGCVPS